MSLSLVDALQQVDLEAGRIYQCRVGQLRIQVRVEEIACELLPAPLEPADVMLDPWTDLPAPQAVAFMDVALVAPVLPDAPLIPSDGRQP
jgi:hypothetical protein